MGGTGSGRWGYWHNGRPVIDNCKQIKPRDIWQAIERGPGPWLYSLAWKRGNQNAGNVGYQIVNHAGAPWPCVLATQSMIGTRLITWHP